MNVTLKQIIVGVVVALSVPILTYGAYALDQRWNQCDTAVVAESNTVSITKMTLQSICEKYRMNFPCSTGPMSAQDKGRYEFYMKQLEKAQKRLDYRMGKG
ncbi:MAG: hypothetical protein GWN00_12740 [Aliifodinibius sp.]|nr:hypothetical protein [Fodinibius sp.]NIV11994.1 hypothetical protein [Fodinibius sp.]NIY25640.1 hypothetical protein [Fodinibius sp.]